MNRYDSYKTSGVEWIGEVPSYWEILSIKRIIVEHSGNGFPIELQGKNGDIPFLKVSDFSENDDKYILKWNNSVADNIAKQKKWNIVPKNSIVTAKIGEALKKNHRKILVENSIIDNNCLGIEIKNADILFGYYLHCAVDFDLFTNPGAVPSLAMDKYRSQKIALPPLSEQTAIAQYLDDKTAKIDQAIMLEEKQIELLKEHKQILIQNAVTKGLNPHVKFKHSGVEWLGEVPEHWEVSTLGKILLPISEKNRPDLPLLSITRELGVIERDIEDQESNHNFIPDDLSNYKVLRKGQFGMNKMKAWQGSYGVSNFTGIVSPAYYIFNFIKSVNSEFFHWAIRSKIYVSFFASASDGVRIGQWDLSKDRMKSIPFVIPSETEQTAIANYLDQQTAKIDHAIQLKQQQIDKLKEYKTVLINDVVTGKVKVA